MTDRFPGITMWILVDLILIEMCVCVFVETVSKLKTIQILFFEEEQCYKFKATFFTRSVQ